MPTPDPHTTIEARRQLLELADLIASSRRPPRDIERTLRVLHPKAVDTLPRRELAAIIELAVRPLRS